MPAVNRQVAYILPGDVHNCSKLFTSVFYFHQGCHQNYQFHVLSVHQNNLPSLNHKATRLPATQLISSKQQMALYTFLFWLFKSRISWHALMLCACAHVHKHTHNCRLFPWHEAVWQTCMCGPVPCVWRVTPDLALSSQLHPVWQHQLWPSTLQGVQNSYSILSIILSLIMYCFIHMFHIKLSLFPQTPQILKLIFIYSTCSSWVSSLSHANHVPTGCHLSQEGKQAGCRLSQQACLASPLDTPYTHTHLHTHPWHKQSPLTPSNMPHLTRLWTTALTQMD